MENLKEEGCYGWFMEEGCCWKSFMKALMRVRVMEMV